MTGLQQGLSLKYSLLHLLGAYSKYFQYFPGSSVGGLSLVFQCIFPVFLGHIQALFSVSVIPISNYIIR